jgi:hypothetical protein
MAWLRHDPIPTPRPFRWNMLHSPLHTAGYALDPEYHGQISGHEDEVKDGLNTIMRRLTPDANVAAQAKLQYIARTGGTNARRALSHQRAAWGGRLPSCAARQHGAAQL